MYVLHVEERPISVILNGDKSQTCVFQVRLKLSRSTLLPLSMPLAYLVNRRGGTLHFALTRHQ